ncbi:ATP-dependent DNA helicase DDX31 [Colletes latitarsis]|uniref:ATP-dependent DNA helicase DDX31 n=1 Tax=Colletes latitarsis TaxID=2605962 RepID=UPI00403708BE
MTVQDTNISLNISAEPVAKKKNENEDDFILSLMKERKNKTEESKVRNSNKPKRDLVRVTTGTKKKRVKQKLLSTIVAQRLKDTDKSNVLHLVQKERKFKTQPIDTEERKSKQRLDKIRLNADNKVVETDKTLATPQTEISNDSAVSFVKFTRGNFGKTLLAKKRNIKNADSRNALPNILSKRTESENVQVSLLKSLKKVDTDEDVVPRKKPKLKESNKSSLTKDVHSETNKNFVEKSIKSQTDIQNSKSTRVPFKTGGKISSLFGHNPKVPNIGQRFVKPISEPVFTETTFTDLNIHPFMISNLKQNMQIAKMTIVQQKAIPCIFSGKDTLIRSQTGSGKTLAYALPIVEFLHNIRPKLNRNSGVKALVVTPTRELALQTYECFLKLIKPFTWIVPGYLAGGEKRKAEKARLRKGCNILVGTPGRLLDHIKRTAALKLGHVKFFVLDEADRMFDMGYEEDISGIVSALKLSTLNENSEYDPMKILGENIKRVSNDGNVAHIENTIDSRKGGENDDDQKNSKPEGCANKDHVRQRKRRYRCNSDDDFEEEKRFVKSKDFSKSNESKVSSSVESDARQKEDENKFKRQTILLSATLTQAVEKLAGLAMEYPVFVDAANENLKTIGDDTNDPNEDLIVPQSIIQSYIVTPAKLRMVTLSAYIAGKCQSHGQHKLLVFMATQDMVDYHVEILSSVLTKPVDEDDDDSDPLVDVDFFKLHGNMTQKERTDVFKTFRQRKSGVLFCTDVAARGLDLPKVDCVIQYTAPTSTRDYVHRIGRTARAGLSGTATIFLVPSEIEFVRMLESRRIRIKQESMDDVLNKLLTPLSQHSSAHNAAITLQNEFENLVLQGSKLRAKACKAYTSWIRFYASYPRDMREIFNRKDLHLGHFAKSFALRETPQRIDGISKKIHEKNISKQQQQQQQQQHTNRLANERADGVPAKKPKHPDDEPRTGLLKKVRMLNTSEYGSGLEPSRKPKKS